MVNSSIIRHVTSFVLIVSLTVGCTTVHTEKLARFRPTAEEKLTTVEATGVYKVRWRREVTEKLSPVHGTSRYLTAGTAVGFERLADGSILAIVGEERIPLPPGPADAKYVMWHTAWEEPSSFGEGLADVGDAAGKVLMAATIVGLVVLALSLDADDDAACGKHHRHHKGCD